MIHLPYVETFAEARLHSLFVVIITIQFYVCRKGWDASGQIVNTMN